LEQHVWKYSDLFVTGTNLNRGKHSESQGPHLCEVQISRRRSKLSVEQFIIKRETEFV